jgi:HAE1 family hydrophobic/amphiphilic exporter-1
MMTMPLAFIGVVWAFVITGKSFDISAFIGIILLVGIVVKNGIVLVDYINNRRRAGMDRRQAILTAGPVRLRPVLMTALAAILGMVPLALNLGSGGSSDQTLAIAVIGGLTIATFLTLIFVPVMYTIAEDLVDMIKEWFQPLLPGVAQMVPKSGDNQS